MDASFEGFTNEQIEEYKRCARLVHAAFSSVEPVSGGYRLILDSSEELQMEDLESFAILEQKACPFLTIKASRISRPGSHPAFQLDMIESPEASGFLKEKLHSYGYV